jgi:hypothetical protein
LRSKFEARVAKSLKDRGCKFEYETHTYNYGIEVPNAECEDCGGRAITDQWYTPDFFLPNGIVVETKGKFTAEHRRKHLAVREAHPDLDLRFCFMRDNKIHRKSQTRYSDWAENNGFKYSIGDIPDEWLE